MIARLTGVVVERNAKSVVLDVGGVGYRVAVLGALQASAAVGSELSLRIHHHVSADAEALYGFKQEEDLRFFELLLTVPSVGPRTAMNVLDIAPPKTLRQAVAAGDVKLLTKVSGIGRKTAERILVELKEKFKDEPVSGIRTDVHEQTLSALINLGYTKAQAREVVQGLPAGVTTVEEAVRHALQQQN